LRGQKHRISKSAKRYYDHVRMVRESPVHGGPAVRAEVKRDGLTAVTPTDVLTGSPLDLHLVSGEARLNTEGAARAPLACEAMTHRNTYWIAHDFERELTTTTTGMARGHAGYSEPSQQTWSIPKRAVGGKARDSLSMWPWRPFIYRGM
jgi:hypothetical protein